MSTLVIDAPSRSLDEPSLPRERRSPPLASSRRSAPRSHVWILLAITLLGGVLRFARPDQPAIWGDEGSTYSRICGTYQQLIDNLQFAGFAPLHYELEWWIKQGLPLRFHFERAPIEPIENLRGGVWRLFGTEKQAATAPAGNNDATLTKRVLIPDHPLIPGGVRMTPQVLRLAPAIAGTLMVPAVWFLAVQLVSRRTALVAALLAATSAYLLNYSHDAKMYMPLWLMGTLNVACFLWWLRARGQTARVAWLCWIASGVVMCGLHAMGAVLLAVELLIFLSTSAVGVLDLRSRWRRQLLPLGGLVLGAAVILAGIGGYYWKFNQFKQRIDAGDWWSDSMLGWVEDYNQGRTGPELARYAATAYLLGWEWPKRSSEAAVPLRTLRMMHGAAYVTGALLLLGLIPWRSWVRNESVPVPAKTQAAHDRPDGVVVGLPLRGTSEKGPVPWHLALLWLLAWIALPAYVLYCISMPNFAGPNQWFRTAWRLIHVPSTLMEPRLAAAVWTAAIAAALGLGIFATAENASLRARKFLALLAVLLIVYLLCESAYWLVLKLSARAAAHGEKWYSIWIPRYLGFIWPALAIAAATLLMRLPTRPLRVFAIGFLVVANLVQFANRVLASEPPTDQLAREVIASQGPQNPQRVYVQPRFGVWENSFEPGRGWYDTISFRYYLSEMTGMKTTPLEVRLGGPLYQKRFTPWVYPSPMSVATNVSRNPQLRRVITWERIDPGKPDLNATDRLEPLLGAEWKRVSERVRPARDHWTWRELYTLRRREYIRVGGGTTPPATRAAARSEMEVQ